MSVAFSGDIPSTNIEVTGTHRLDQFVATQPPTHGLYEGLVEYDGVYVSPTIFDDAEVLPTVQDFRIMPGAFLGAGASHHQVMFGEVEVDMAGEVRHLEAAIKPFVAGSGFAEHEHDCLAEVSRRGLDTYQPLALARDGDTTYLVTRLRAEPETLDNQNWLISPTATPDLYEDVVIPNLEYVARGMATMHGKGIFHGDAQVKNFARTDTGGFLVMDLEDATIAMNPDQHVLLANVGDFDSDSKAVEDVAHCWRALIYPSEDNHGSPFLEGESRETCMTEFDEHYLKPYLSALQELTPPEILGQIDTAQIAAAAYTKIDRIT